MSKFVLTLALSALLLLVACAMSPEHAAQVRVVFDEMLAQGQLTVEQHAALIAALTANDWSQVWETALEIGAAVLLALTGVRIQRGSILARKGYAPVASVATHTATVTAAVPPGAPSNAA